MLSKMMYGGDCAKTICVILAIIVIALFVIFAVGFYKAWKETLSTSAAKGLYITALVAAILAFILLVWWFVKYCWGCDWGCGAGMDMAMTDACGRRLNTCAPGMNRMSPMAPMAARGGRSPVLV